MMWLKNTKPLASSYSREDQLESISDVARSSRHKHQPQECQACIILSAGGLYVLKITFQMTLVLHVYISHTSRKNSRGFTVT